MGSVSVVVVDVVGDELFELLLVPDNGSVKELAAQGPDPAFGERVRDWGFEDVEAFGSEDLVEGVDELTAPVADQRPRIGESVWVSQEEVPGGLAGPGSGRVGGDPGEEHFACGDVDEEQQVVTAHQRCVDAGEVTGDGSLGSQELGPSHVGATGCGVDALVLEDSPDGGGAYVVAEAGEFAVDSAVAPRWVVGSHVEDEPANRGVS